MMTFNNKIFKRILFVMLTIAGIPAMAQTQDAAPMSSQDSLLLIVLALVLVVAILVLIVAIYLVVVLKTILKKELGLTTAVGTSHVKEKKPGLWKRLKGQLTDAVPVEKEDEILLEHDYDGIQELDNHLPPWWKWLFYFTIVVGIVYLLGYHVFHIFPSMEEEYATEMKEAEEMQATLASTGKVETVDIENPEQSKDPEIIADGKSIFTTNCVSCHAQDGGGNIGPNLTDQYWLHGGAFKNIFHTVYNGVDGTSMIAWKNVLSPVQVRNVASYVASLQGTTPANPKAPQGELYTPQKQEEQPADTTNQNKTLSQTVTE